MGRKGVYVIVVSYIHEGRKRRRQRHVKAHGPSSAMFYVLETLADELKVDCETLNVRKIDVTWP